MSGATVIMVCNVLNFILYMIKVFVPCVEMVVCWKISFTNCKESIFVSIDEIWIFLWGLLYHVGIKNALCESTAWLFSCVKKLFTKYVMFVLKSLGLFSIGLYIFKQRENKLLFRCWQTNNNIIWSGQSWTIHVQNFWTTINIW